MAFVPNWVDALPSFQWQIVCSVRYEWMSIHLRCECALSYTQMARVGEKASWVKLPPALPNLRFPAVRWLSNSPCVVCWISNGWTSHLLFFALVKINLVSGPSDLRHDMVGKGSGLRAVWLRRVLQKSRFFWEVWPVLTQWLHTDQVSSSCIVSQTGNTWNRTSCWILLICKGRISWQKSSLNSLIPKRHTGRKMIIFVSPLPSIFVAWIKTPGCQVYLLCFLFLFLSFFFFFFFFWWKNAGFFTWCRHLSFFVLTSMQ